MIKIKNNYYELNIDNERGVIDSLLKSGKNLLSDNQPPLMSARFRLNKGEILDLNSKNATCTYEEKENEVKDSSKEKTEEAENKSNGNEKSQKKSKEEGVQYERVDKGRKIPLSEGSAGAGGTVWTDLEIRLSPAFPYSGGDRPDERS